MLRSLILLACCTGTASAAVPPEATSTATAPAATQTSNPADLKVHRLTDFSIAVPADWVEVSNPKLLLTLRSPSEGPWDRFLENLQVREVPLTRPTTIEAAVAESRAEVAAEFKVVDEGEFTNASGRMFWWAITPNETSSLSKELTTIDFMAERGDRVLLFVFTTPSVRYADNLPKFRTIAESVTFTKPYAPHPMAAAAVAEPEVSDARRQGLLIGKYTACALLAAVVIWGGFTRLVRLFGG